MLGRQLKESICSCRVVGGWVVGGPSDAIPNKSPNLWI